MGHSPVEGNISSCGSLCARVCKDIQHHCKTWSSFLCYVHFYLYRGVKLYNQYKIQHFHWLHQLEKLVEYHQSNLVYFRKCLLCILGQTPWDTSSTFEGGRWGRRLSIFSMWALKSYVAGLLESYFMLTGSVVKSLRSVSPMGQGLSLKLTSHKRVHIKEVLSDWVPLNTETPAGLLFPPHFSFHTSNFQIFNQISQWHDISGAFPWK